MSESSDTVLPLSASEKKLVAHIEKNWNSHRALSELKSHLQVAVEIELATIPIYLFTYYSINRTPKYEAKGEKKQFPDTRLSRFADQAGAAIMSVAVEEMLHMSLASNILFALGQQPELYLKSPGPYPSNLPGHAKLGPNKKPLELPLAKLSLEQMWHFLEIEYPSESDAPPQDGNWSTIGQIYSYIRCIIASNLINDSDFQQGEHLRQIQATNYSPNNIDTAFPAKKFNKSKAPEQADSAAKATQFMSREDSHAGAFQLLTIESCSTALQAIQTIDAQGEGYGPHKFDDPSHEELSHYYKFLSVQSQLEGYDSKHEKIPKKPKAPEAADKPITKDELAKVVINMPDNPIAATYASGHKELADVISGLYQYMLIMTESIFLQEPAEQKRYFNQALHRSMIWILDKVIQNMRKVPLNNGATTQQYLAPTFENINLGTRDAAFKNLGTLCEKFISDFGTADWVSSDLLGYIKLIPSLPDVSGLWAAEGSLAERFQGVPKFPANPPEAVAYNEARHACMGLNHCKGQGRTRDNNCAGQGYCSTALGYNYSNPLSPQVSDHTCHVKNNCAGQGGCGLYGTAEEQNHPGGNDCATLGSCATPINAERFSSDGPNRGKSVWLRARAVFEEQTWPKIREQNPELPYYPPKGPHPELFAYGPTIEWIHKYSGGGMTACGASGLSGANSCA